MPVAPDPPVTGTTVAPPITAAARAAASRRDDVLRGIMFMVMSCVIWATINALIKGLSRTIPVGEMMFFRCLFAFIPTLWLVRRERDLSVMRTTRPWGHLGRSMCGIASMGSGFLSYTILPLADAQAISYAGPLFLTMLSIPLLGEKVGLHRWSAVVVGFLGVLLIVGPGGGLFGTLLGGGGAGAAGFPLHGFAAALSNAFFFALGSILVRQLSLVEHSVTIVFYHTIFSTMVSATLLVFGWVTPNFWELVGLVCMGLAGGIAQFWSTLAYRYAAASIVGPYTYSSMFWTALWGFVFFSEIPTLWTIGGCALLVGSGLYILHREIYWRRRRAAEDRARIEAAGKIA